MKIAPIFDSEKRRDAPQAEQVDLHIIFSLGTALWLLSTLLFSILYFMYGLCLHGFIISLCGTIIGILALVWELYNRHGYRLVALMQQ